MVAPLFFSSMISFLRSSAFMGSKPLNGSSKMRSSGSWSTVVMNWTFWAIPFDSSSTFLSHHDSISNFSNQYFRRLSASVLDRPLSWHRYRACSPTFIFLYSPRSSGR